MRKAEASAPRATGPAATSPRTPCRYVASDNVESERYRGLTPADLIDIAVVNGLHFHAATLEGVVFHMIGALSEHGKLGLVCVAASAERAVALYDDTLALLDREAGR
jgi:hypothetical protein